YDTDSGDPVAKRDIRANKITQNVDPADPAASMSWGPNGKTICSADGDQRMKSIAIATNGDLLFDYETMQYGLGNNTHVGSCRVNPATGDPVTGWDTIGKQSSPIDNGVDHINPTVIPTSTNGALHSWQRTGNPGIGCSATLPDGKIGWTLEIDLT